MTLPIMFPSTLPIRLPAEGDMPDCITAPRISNGFICALLIEDSFGIGRNICGYFRKPPSAAGQRGRLERQGLARAALTHGLRHSAQCE
jgi:hypothetical protein